MVTNEYRHIPVLLSECMQQLGLEEGQVFVDATLGGGGHSLAAASRIGSSGMLIGIDQDRDAISVATEKLQQLPEQRRPRILCYQRNFSELDDILLDAQVPGIDAILFDLGISSYQVDTPSRGFSYRETGPLDMRMNPSKQTLTAAEIVNTTNAADLARIIRLYSDEKWAGRIADRIVYARTVRPIDDTLQLAEIVKEAIPAKYRRRGGHPAKRTFQALRIAVNSELEVLQSALDAAVRWLNPEGRIAVISYHSLEDRLVKDSFAGFADRCTCPPDFPVCVCHRMPILTVLTKKPVCASASELEDNPRARSAKLRVAQKRAEGL